MDEFFADLEISDILKEKKKDDNVELHQKLMTSFWVAAVTFGEYLHQICYHSWNRIKSLTFLMSSAKISHHRGLTSFWWKGPFLWITSHVRCCYNEMRICNYITKESLHFGSQQSSLVNTCVKYVILPATGLNLSPLPWAIERYNITEESLHLHGNISSRGLIVLFIIPSLSNEMRICNYITKKSLHFGSQQSHFDTSVKYGILPARRLNLSPFPSAM